MKLKKWIIFGQKQMEEAALKKKISAKNQDKKSVNSDNKPQKP